MNSIAQLSQLWLCPSGRERNRKRRLSVLLFLFSFKNIFYIFLSACILMFRQAPSVDIFTQTGTQMYAFSLSQSDNLTQIQLQTCKASDCRWKCEKRSIRAPCGNFTSHCTPFAGTNVVRIHKAAGAYVAFTRANCTPEAWASS